MKTKFDPTIFLGKGWRIESDNGFNPSDLSGITIGNYLKEGEEYITGEVALERSQKAGDKSLNADVFLRLWENQKLIPKEWHEVAYNGYIEFMGTILRHPHGRRHFLYLSRLGDGSWYWDYHWLDSDRYRDNVSPLLASNT